MNDAEQPSLESVKLAIHALDRADRASLRPWILARFDDDGDSQHGYQPPPRWSLFSFASSAMC
jgi:hypothetical protein